MSVDCLLLEYFCLLACFSFVFQTKSLSFGVCQPAERITWIAIDFPFCVFFCCCGFPESRAHRALFWPERENNFYCYAWLVRCAHITWTLSHGKSQIYHQFIIGKFRYVGHMNIAAVQYRKLRFSLSSSRMYCLLACSKTNVLLSSACSHTHTPASQHFQLPKIAPVPKRKKKDDDDLLTRVAAPIAAAQWQSQPISTQPKRMLKDNSFGMTFFERALADDCLCKYLDESKFEKKKKIETLVYSTQTHQMIII